MALLPDLLLALEDELDVFMLYAFTAFLGMLGKSAVLMPFELADVPVQVEAWL